MITVACFSEVKQQIYHVTKKKKIKNWATEIEDLLLRKKKVMKYCSWPQAGAVVECAWTAYSNYI